MKHITVNGYRVPRFKTRVVLNRVVAYLLRNPNSARPALVRHIVQRSWSHNRSIIVRLLAPAHPCQGPIITRRRDADGTIRFNVTPGAEVLGTRVRCDTVAWRRRRRRRRLLRKCRRVVAARRRVARLMLVIGDIVLVGGCLGMYLGLNADGFVLVHFGEHAIEECYHDETTRAWAPYLCANSTGEDT